MFNQRTQSVTGVIAGASAVLLSCGLAGAEIYEWEYIDPLNPSLGRQASSTVLSTEDPVPRVDLRYTALPKAYLAGADLTAAAFRQADLTNADMYGANLSAATFREATLTGAIFYDAIIRNADFSSTTSRGFTQQQLAETASYRAGVLTGVVLAENNLTGWDFSGLNLTGTQFGTIYFDLSFWHSASNLTNADFSGSLLTYTSFLDATVTGADFSGAIVAGVGMNNATGFTFQQLASTLSYQAGDLSGIGLSRQDMAGWDLSGQNLTNAYMSYGNLTGTDLSDANLTSANLSYADLAGANLSGADLTDATLQHADIPNANFAGANLTEATLMQMDATNADFTGANLTRSGFKDSNITGVIFTDANITRASFSGSTAISLAQLTSTANYQLGDLAGIGIQSYASGPQQDLSGINFSGFNLAGATLRATFDDADFSNADLAGATLDRTSLIGADFTDAVVDNASLNSLSLQQLQSTANYKAQNLSMIRFDYADMSGLDLSGFNLAGFSSYASELSSTDFSGADLTDAGFGLSNLTGADFTDAEVKGIHLAGVTDNGFTYQQLASTASFKDGDLGDISLIRNDLSGWDLSDLSMVGAGLGSSGLSVAPTNLTGTNLSRSDLTGANFIQSILTGTDFTDAVIKDAKFKDAVNLTNAQVMSTASYKTGDLSGILWWNLDLSGWDLSGVSLSDGDFEDAEMIGINLSGSDLTGSDFYRADLMNANLRNANLSNTVWRSADLTGADLAGAVVRGMYPGSGIGMTRAQIESTASFQSRDMTGFHFPNNGNISYMGWNLSGFNLTDAIFGNAHVIDVDFSGARLAYVDFSHSAMLTGAGLAGADTRGAELTESQINSASDITNMIWPDGSMRNGLVLSAGEQFQLFDLLPPETVYGIPPIPPDGVMVHDSFVLAGGGTLRMVLTDLDWQSTVRFDPSVGTANLDGTLELGVELLDGIGMQDLLGNTFQLFDWSGVSVVGGFDTIVLDDGWHQAGLSVDFSELLSTGSVSVVPFLGDLDGDGFVGIDDLMVVLAHWNQAVTPGDMLAGDFDGDGFVGVDDLNRVLGTWNMGVAPPGSQAAGAVPEPMTGVLLVVGGVCLIRRRR